MMSSDNLQSKPLVSVIIPCFNQGKFLAEAIASVQKQTYPRVEIIVIDDGSVDDTRSVALSAGVKYYYQENAGLSAARNTGIARSNGFFLVFLDADDILYPNAIEVNLEYLLQNPSWAFVSGGHDKVDEWLYPLNEIDETQPVVDNPYLALLQGNFIGMHAAVMYRCRVFDTMKFDTTLGACEDYDLYLRIARQFPVGNHNIKLAAYRHHGQNMSSDLVKMLRQVLKVHQRQMPLLKSEDEKNAWKTGRQTWKDYYAHLLCKRSFDGIKKQAAWLSFAEMKMLAVAMPGRFAQYAVRKIRHNSVQMLKRNLPDSLL